MKKLALTAAVGLVAAFGSAGGALAIGGPLPPQPKPGPAQASCPTPAATGSALPCKIVR
jgi:hypothetical protein